MKINIGGGKSWQEEGWTNLDISCGYDLNEKLLNDFKDNSIDLIYTSHCLEHLIYQNVYKILKNTYRILKKDKIIRIVIPCTDKLLNMLENKDINSLNKSRYYRKRPNQSLEFSILEQFGLTGTCPHLSYFSKTDIKLFLMLSGFCKDNIKFKTFNESSQKKICKPLTLDNNKSPYNGFDMEDHIPISCYIEAIK